MSIFGPGIVWDPREPLPPEYDEGSGVDPPGGWAPTRHIAPPVEGDLAWPTRGHDELQKASYPDSALYSRSFNPRGEDTDGFSLPATNGRKRTENTGQASNLPLPGKTLPDFTVQEPTRNILSPLSISLDVSIVQDTARVTATQLFWNNSTRSIQKGSYTFPLPDDCTVSDFSCRIGARKIIKGVVKPKQEAKEYFQNHVNQNHTAGLLEQEAPEIFTTSLGNLPPNTRIKAKLSFITLLKHRFADHRRTTALTLPTYIAARYGSPLGFTASVPTDVPQGLHLRIEVLESNKIRHVSSKTHKIVVKRKSGRRDADSWADITGNLRSVDEKDQITLIELQSAFLDRDFVLDIETEPEGEAEAPKAWLEKHAAIENQQALMLILPSNFIFQTKKVQQPTEILFLADRSGSMEDKMASLKSAMVFFLKGIPVERKFNIWSFGSFYEAWRPQSTEYSDQSLQAALYFVHYRLAANMGGTDLLPALKAMVATRDTSMMTDIIVLTDGQVWRLEQTLAFIRDVKNNSGGRVRFFSLGIGDAVSHALVEGIAKHGGGYSEVIPSSNQGYWEDRVVSMAKAALFSDHIGPIHINLDIEDEQGQVSEYDFESAIRSPEDISGLNPFIDHRIYLILDPTLPPPKVRSITIKAWSVDGAETYARVPVSYVEKNDTTIHKLAARSLLNDLEHKNEHFERAWNWNDAVREQAEKIACKWSIVSKWTSFFLAEERYESRELDSFMDKIVEVNDFVGDGLLRPIMETQSFLLANQQQHQSDPMAIDDPDPLNFCDSVYDGPRYPGTGAPRYTGAAASYSTQRGYPSTSGGTYAGYAQLSSPPEYPGTGPSLYGNDFGRYLDYFEFVGSSSRSRSYSAQGGHPATQRYPAYAAYPASCENSSGAAYAACQSQAAYPASSGYSSLDGAYAGYQQAPSPANYGHPCQPDTTEIFGRSVPIFGATIDTLTSKPVQISNGDQVVHYTQSPTVSADCLDVPSPSRTDNTTGSDTQTYHSQEDSIRVLLDFQNADGSMGFQSREEAEKYLGSSIIATVLHLTSGMTVSDNLVYTAALVIILERRYRTCKKLWELMHAKASAFLGEHWTGIADCELPNLMHKLQSFAIPLDEPTGLKRLSTPGGAVEKEASRYRFNKGNRVDSSRSRRMAMERAPIEE
ncbi:Fc.00g005130.m01.CDS01 [Cosmosporella sp. VM-42]